ncbi:MAG: CCA tRNA nucleotidyltransferase, mitochondrial [Lichina confinis]|nr:MAG: CCA tRNA nucleotidyltransferase, mitochondrial [Lichina confinis]
MLPTETMQEMTLPAIELSTVEETLKRLLLDVAHFIDSSSLNTSERPPGRLPTVLRFTGGWVRDKLLGADSQDIDVAINNMTGLQFGLELQKYLNIAENPRKYGIGSNVQLSAEPIPEGGSKTDPSLSKGSGALGGLHKIEANPEKSKHLETVTTKVLGLDIDLVNLRTETYSEASRNPQMAFGTPEEDALRRDATVNALFYNLSTSSVEDFTGLGLSDMRSEILRTPLEPRQTFLDDPLRVLRLIRFASRLDYSIESNTEEAMDDEIIRSALTMPATVAREGIRIPSKTHAVISAAFTNANAIASLQRRAAEHTGAQGPASLESQLIARDELGMVMRRWGASWRSQVLLSILLDTVRSDTSGVAQDGPSIINGYAAFLRLVENFDLLEVHSIKPLVNGKDLMNAFNAVSGPWLKEALNVAVAWQLRNPGVTDTQAAIREVERNRLRLKIP